MASMRLFNELTRVEATVLAPESILLLPVGATEQHGPHLPVGTDSFAIEHLAREAASAAAEQVPVVVAPTLPFTSGGLLEGLNPASPTPTPSKLTPAGVGAETSAPALVWSGDSGPPLCVGGLGLIGIG